MIPHDFLNNWTDPISGLAGLGILFGVSDDILVSRVGCIAYYIISHFKFVWRDREKVNHGKNADRLGLLRKYHKCIFTGIADISVRMITSFLSIAGRDVRDPGGITTKHYSSDFSDFFCG